MCTVPVKQTNKYCNSLIIKLIDISYVNFLSNEKMPAVVQNTPYNKFISLLNIHSAVLRQHYSYGVHILLCIEELLQQDQR